MENQKPFTPNGNFDALMRIYKSEVPPTQGVAIATDAGTSEGVKKSWLKRERAKQEGDVDTLDKGKRNERAVAAKPIREEIEKEGGKMPTKADVDKLLIELGKSNDGGKGEWSYWQVMKVLHALSKDMK